MQEQQNELVAEISAQNAIAVTAFIYGVVTFLTTAGEL